MDDNHSSIQIVPMDYSHVERVSQIEYECFPNPWSYDAYLSELSNPLAVVLVAIVNDEVAGYIDIHHVLDECHINNLAVTAKFRNLKIATKLLEAIYDYAKNNDVSYISLEVRESNESARALYIRDGFEEVGKRKGFYVNPSEDAILMNKYF